MSFVRLLKGFTPDGKSTDTTEWASPDEVDRLLAKNARLEQRLESRTSPMTWLFLGALGGILYYTARKEIVDERITRAMERVFI